MNSWTLHKFGGSSLRDADCFRQVARLLAEDDSPRVGVVVSAMGGLTDRLLRLARLAERDDRGFAAELDTIGRLVAELVDDLLSPAARAAYLDAWCEDAGTLTELLTGIAARRTLTPAQRDRISGYGEIWSARLMAAWLAESLGSNVAGDWIDARDVVTVHHTELGPAVNWEKSRARLERVLPDAASRVVAITGFIARDEAGDQTTLGRNGSDFSASIFAALLGAAELTIWTDVDGVLSGDPRRVPEARIIRSLSYDEAAELAYFGASVLHPQTLGPAIDNGIRVRIRNTFRPEAEGTLIGKVAEGRSIKGITAIDDLAIVNLEGSGMIGVPGTASRLFAALQRAGISVTLISQASSEHSICLAVPQARAEHAAAVIREAFAEELADGQISRVEIDASHSVIAVVGDGMAGASGVAARFFGSLGRAGVNVRAIAQGSSERNISAVVSSRDATRALRAAHAGFYLSAKTLSIGLIGPGVVGAALLEQLRDRRAVLRNARQLDLRIRAIARSQRMLLTEEPDLDGWRAALAADGETADLDRFADHVQAEHLPHAVIVDCTASPAIAARYADWLRRGIHVVTPNKKAFSSDLAYRDALREAAEAGRAHCLFETTVGAALPIIQTLRDLVDTGDRVHAINGILSGTLAYLFNVYDGSVPFSTIVREARDSGYTEPDPRDDLSGMDVARKLTILARELGRPLSLGDFPVENLVPEALCDCSVDEFLARLPEFDAEIAARFDAAKAEGKVLRYVARLAADGHAEVGLKAVDPASALANIRLTDNIVQFTTDRYADNPLVVQGPGAGPAVTAGGVFGDLLKLAMWLEGQHG